MPTNRLIACLAAVGWFMIAGSALATPSALIVIGTAGTPTIANDLAAVAQTIKAGLVQRGFAPDSIEIVGPPTPDNKVTSDLVLTSLKKREALAATDEFWLVLLGFAGRTSDGSPAIQVNGPRLTAADLKTALEAIPAQQFVFVGTSDSGAFAPILLKKDRPVLSATRENGEIDLPRFPQFWAEALKEKPQGGWNEIAANAAARTEKSYTDNGLAFGEHARMGDPATGKILEAPFGVDSTAKPAAATKSDGKMALVNAADIKVDIRKPNAEWEKQEATPETTKLIADAKAVPNPDGFNSIILTQRLGYTIGEDRTAEESVMRRVYIEKEDGVERWANFTFPQDPPAVTTKLEAARIIQPDGSSTVFNPAKMPPATSVTSEMGNALTTVFMPDAHAGCLIEISYRTRYLLDVSSPQFSEGMPVQLDVPALHTELQLQAAEKGPLHFKLRNSDQKPTEVLANGIRTLSWKLENLPAFEALPFDPPARDSLISLDISSLDSWDAFATWYRRLAKGSDAQDATVKAKAEELAEGAKTRLDKIRRAYEFVSALRYVAIEIGVNGYRPRTPTVVLQNRYGDCKDKANLLIALLKDMEIDAKFVLLNRGSSTDTSFPSNQFNHAIAYVPKVPDAGQPDDLWLDTTDSTAPFQTLAPGDIGRNALVFDKDSAKFLTVTAAGKEVTNIEEHWEYFPLSSSLAYSHFKGTVVMTWTGLAEYDIRSMIRGRTPRQRDFALQTELTRQLPEGDFSNLKLTPADDLSQPMRLDATLGMYTTTTSGIPRPLPSFNIASMFATPERNHSLLINNGQKLRLIQIVETNGLNKIPTDFDETVAGIHASIKWTITKRTAELTIDQPLISSTDYPQVRDLLRRWTENLSP